MNTENAKGTSSADKERVLTHAVLKAAAGLGIKAADLVEVLGLSSATVSRMMNNTYLLKEHKKEFEIGLEIVRLFRGIDAISGGDDGTNKSWMRAKNTVLGDKPIVLIKKLGGLFRTVSYVDTFRAKV